MFSRSVFGFACLALCASAHAGDGKLTVSGASEIAKIGYLTLQEGGRLMWQGQAPAQVGDRGELQLAPGWKPATLASARIVFQGRQIGSVNGAGTKATDISGLPLSKKWIENLLHPKDPVKLKPTAPAVATMNAQIMNGDSANGPELGINGDVRITSVNVNINTHPFKMGSMVTMPPGGGDVKWDYTFDCPNGKRPATVHVKVNVLGETKEYSYSYTPPGSMKGSGSFYFTPKHFGDHKVDFTLTTRTQGDLNVANNVTHVRGVVHVNAPPPPKN